MQRDLDSQASFEDEHYFLHIPLLFGPLCIFYYFYGDRRRRMDGHGTPVLPKNSPNHLSLAISLGLQQSYQ